MAEGGTGLQLSSWREEVQGLTGGTIVVVRVETDKGENVLRIPPEFPGRPVVRELLLKEAFVAQLVRAHALSVNYSGAEGTFHFILLNMALEEDWRGIEDLLLAHELGHIWLNAIGYRAPSFDNACLSTHSGDIVQHVLIREETRRRGYDYMRFWIRNQDKWLLGQERTDTAIVPDACQRLQLLSAWMDATLGVTSAEWDRLDRYLNLLRSRYPELRPAVADLTALLRGLDLWDRSVYEFALGRVSQTLTKLMW